VLRQPVAAFLGRAVFLSFFLFIHLTGVGSGVDSSGRPVDHEPIWGVNGHPINQEAYWGNMELQMEVMKTIGLRYYRVDIPYSGDGIPDSLSADRLYHLYELAVRGDITIVPIIFLPEARVLYGMDPETAYKSGFAIGAGFAHRYKGYFQYYEMGNEYDGDVMKLPAGDGSDTAHYDMARIRILGSALRGMSDGIRLENTKASIIVNNAGWMHYAYFQLLEGEGVKFDIIGYHWYEDVAHLKLALDALHSYFPGRPVWFTEINARNKGAGYSPRYQKNHVKKYIKVIRRRGKNIMGFFVYELFDEPAHREPKERSYGLVSWKEPYKGFLYKPLAIFLLKRKKQEKK